MKFELTEQQLAVIGAALGKAPLAYELTSPVIAELQKQINENVHNVNGQAQAAADANGKGAQDQAA